MNISFIPHDSCTGCGACENVCPSGCIHMQMDDEKFDYPVINGDKCIHCNKCEEVCPVKNKKNVESEERPTAYAFIVNDEAIRHASSSGGVFSVFANYVLDKDGVVFGVALSDNCRKISHMVIENKDELYKLRGSKYIQSSIGRSYQEAKKFLENQRWVLFTGTPCQIEGLKKYLGKEYANLLTIDLICHGVPSQYVWNKYLDYHENRFGAAVRRVSFRHKKYGWYTFSMLLEFSNNVEYLELLSKDLYLQAFLNNACLRPCCHICHFKTVSRVSDFTMADLWGIDKICPEWNDDKGVSLLLVHSEKGADILEQIKPTCKIKEVDLEVAISNNNMAIKSMVPHPKRNQFIQNIDCMEFDKLVQKYGTVPFSTIKRQVGRILRKLGLR